MSLRFLFRKNYMIHHPLDDYSQVEKEHHPFVESNHLLHQDQLGMASSLPNQLDRVPIRNLDQVFRSCILLPFHIRSEQLGDHHDFLD